PPIAGPAGAAGPSASGAASASGGASGQAAEAGGLGEGIQALKKEAIDLNRELCMLEEELLFPANTQVAVFLSLDVGELFQLESVTLRLDQQEVAHHLYEPREIAALAKGGVQRLYLG